MKYAVTFMATGGLEIEADSEEEALEKFENELQEDAENELVLNGIDITEVTKSEDE